jgi:hypothetical protein
MFSKGCKGWWRTRDLLFLVYFLSTQPMSHNLMSFSQHFFSQDAVITLQPSATDASESMLSTSSTAIPLPVSPVKVK